MQESNPIIADFLEEARVICEQKPFLGPPNHAMFWAHIDGLAHTRNPSLSAIRNCTLCTIYTDKFNASAYQLGDVDRDSRIAKFFDRYVRDYPPEITNKAWHIFSEAYAQQAQGDHIYVAANDAKTDDWFITSELPVIQRKTKSVTSLEPLIDAKSMFTVKATLWNFDDWLKVQKAQWEKPFYYLDGTPYPAALIMP